MQENWDNWGKVDPLWAITTFDDKKDNQWNKEEFFATGVQDIDVTMKHVESLGVDFPHKKALDFGCGVGKLTQALAGHFDEVCGVDIAPSMIEQAQEYNAHGGKCQYFVNGAYDLKLFAGRTFDFVFTKAVLQHIRPHYSKIYIREFVRLLAPKGLLVFQLHSEMRNSGLKDRIQSVMPYKMLYLYRDIKRGIHKKPTIEMYGLKRQSVEKLLERVGGKIVDIIADPSSSGAWETYQYYVTRD